MGNAASQVVAENRGALGLSLDMIGQVLDAQPHARRRLAHAVPDAE
jgi:hypothetical protein